MATTNTITQAPAPLCSCGCSTAHKIGRRQTADGVRLVLWSDGTITSGMGFYLPGLGTARSDYAAGLDLAAGWLAMAEVELYDFAEVPRLVQAARRAVRQACDLPREAMLRYFRGERIRPLKSGRTFRWESPR